MIFVKFLGEGLFLLFIVFNIGILFKVNFVRRKLGIWYSYVMWFMVFKNVFLICVGVFNFIIFDSV